MGLGGAEGADDLVARVGQRIADSLTHHTRGSDMQDLHVVSLGQAWAKMVACQGLAATAVMSDLTCLTWVYSSKEYVDMSLP